MINAGFRFVRIIVFEGIVEVPLLWDSTRYCHIIIQCYEKNTYCIGREYCFRKRAGQSKKPNSLRVKKALSCQL